MRIESIPQPPVRLLADSRSPASSFVDMISDPRTVAGDGGPQGALGFQALGMFGRHGAVEYADGKQPPSIETSVSEASSPSSPSAVARSDRGATVIGHAAASGMPGAPGRPVRQTSVQPVPETARTRRPTTDGLAIEAAVTNAATEEVMLPPTLRSGSRKNQGRPEARITLALFRSGAGVAVTVTAPGLSVCEIQRFRERADALLRDHGMLLDKVAVNGEGPVRGDASQGSQEQWR